MDKLQKKFGNSYASGAIGEAVGKNSLAFLTPCHRVLRASGKNGYYRRVPNEKKKCSAGISP
ncbi:MAG: methylated-DNA--[protein]-cysteine S-methyltransferase [Bacteroidales bacterium]|nr:methylated-DNA--[protein]-cysteine S-methyltransferase [Bacteroidales bacterium]